MTENESCEQNKNLKPPRLKRTVPCVWVYSAGDAYVAGTNRGHGPAERGRRVPEVAHVAAEVAEDVRDADLHIRRRGSSFVRFSSVQEHERVGSGAEDGERGRDGGGRRQREHARPADAEVGGDVGQEARRHARSAVVSTYSSIDLWGGN
jgi:hypothetical protein